MSLLSSLGLGSHLGRFSGRGCALGENLGGILGRRWQRLVTGASGSQVTVNVRNYEPKATHGLGLGWTGVEGLVDSGDDLHDRVAFV